jgi:hypothetical protein
MVDTMKAYIRPDWRFDMTPERAHAYRRVLYTLQELGPSKLQSAEQELIRDAADSLLFTHDLSHDTSARNALRDVETLCGTLVESGRWEQITAERMAADVAQCGPGVAVPILEAA